MVRDLVIDASVAAKWMLVDEPGADEAQYLHARHVSGEIALVAPQQIEVEVTAALRRAALSGRLTREDAREQLSRWLGRAEDVLILFPNALLIADAYERALDLGVTLFDALYVELATVLDAPLVTADERFLRSPAASLPFVRALGDPL